MTTEVRVLLLQANTILLVQGKRTIATQAWELPGGQVHDAESYEHAAKRELREETGLQLTIACPLLSWHRPTPVWARSITM